MPYTILESCRSAVPSRSVPPFPAEKSVRHTVPADLIIFCGKNEILLFCTDTKEGHPPFPFRSGHSGKISLFRRTPSGVVGTLGYLAPEYVSTGRASKESDVYSFGVVALEIATGRKSVDKQLEKGLLDWIWDLYGNGQLISAMDERMQTGFEPKQVECLMIVGLWCAHPDRTLRPSIRQASRVLSFEADMPQLPTKMPIAMYYAPR